MSVSLSIVVLEPDQERARLIVESLHAAGDHEVQVICKSAALAQRIGQADPDIVLIDTAVHSRDTLEELALAFGPLDRPVAMFVDRSEQGLAGAPIEAEISAHVIDSLQATRLKAVLNAAMARFRMFRQMRTELAATRCALDESKVVDRCGRVKSSRRFTGAATPCPRAASMRWWQPAPTQFRASPRARRWRPPSRPMPRGGSASRSRVRSRAAATGRG